MTDSGGSVPDYIRRLPKSGKTRPMEQASSRARPIPLHLNENPFGPSPLAIKALNEALKEVHRYPEPYPVDLQREIASFHHVNPEQVLVTAGATEFLGMIARALLGPGLNAITSAKSFLVYRMATEATKGRLIEVPTFNDGYDLDAIAKVMDRNTRVVFIANPNNPTGTLLSTEEMNGFVTRLPDRVLLVLDEAYGDFAEYFARKRSTPIATYSRSLEYVAHNRNVIVLKTFSKTHGLAGLRVGYGIAPARLISLFAPLRTIFSVSSLAQIAAAAALHDSEHIRRCVENNAEQADVLDNALHELGFSPPQTWANFLYVELGSEAVAVADRLRERGVLVQTLGLWGAPTAVRVSIGTAEENQQFRKAMKSIRATT